MPTDPDRTNTFTVPRPPMAVQSLGSGSSGNAFLIEAAGTTMLLDCGVGIRTITRALRDRSLRLRDLDAVLVTHEHSDHIRTLSCVYGHDIPVIATAGTRRRANIPPPQWEEITFARPVTVGTLTIWAIMVRHDAAEPCGFLVESLDARVAVFTDLGSWHDRLVDPISASDLVVLESNHDHEMLMRGPYPMHLKRRVASDVGHLSNTDCALALTTTLAAAARRPAIWLAHLSETNNLPTLAHQQTSDALAARGLDLEVTALPRREPGPIWTSAGSRAPGVWAPRPKPPASLQLSMDTLF